MRKISNFIKHKHPSGLADADDIQGAIVDDHTHDNKALLDTYTQTEIDLASAVGLIAKMIVIENSIFTELDYNGDLTPIA